MTECERRWYPGPGDEGRIRAHLLRQRGLDDRIEVQLDTGEVVRVGFDAEGEADECD